MHKSEGYNQEHRGDLITLRMPVSFRTAKYYKRCSGSL